MSIVKIEKRPPQGYALQFTGTNLGEVSMFLAGKGVKNARVLQDLRDLSEKPRLVFTKDGQEYEVHEGDWLVSDDESKLNLLDTRTLDQHYTIIE